ncbi:hypothetical protein NN561_015062 [Cricetulus griseus]
MLAILAEGSSKVHPPCDLLYNPVGSRYPAPSSRETVRQSPRVRDAMPGGTAPATPNASSSFYAGCSARRGASRRRPSLLSNSRHLSLSTPTPTTSSRQSDPCDPAWLLAELPNERTTSGNFLPMATLPASRPSPPPGWVLPRRRSHRGSRRPAPGTGCKRSAAAGAGAGCLSEGSQSSGGAVSITVRVSQEPKFSSNFAGGTWQGRVTLLSSAVLEPN